MFESILGEMEKISKNLGNAGLGKVQNRPSPLEQKVNVLIRKIMDLKIPVYKPDLRPVLDKLDAIINRLNLTKASQHQTAPEEHNRLSPTALKRPPAPLVRSRIVWLISILLLTSIGYNISLVWDRDRFNEGYQKYQFIYYSGNHKYLNQLDSTWRIDSIRSDYLQFIQRRKLELSPIDNQSSNNLLKDTKDTLKLWK